MIYNDYPAEWESVSAILKKDKEVWEYDELLALAENPSDYEDNQECLDFAAKEMLDIYGLSLSSETM